MCSHGPVLVVLLFCVSLSLVHGDASPVIPAPILVYPAEGCTAMVFGPKSSLDGSMTTHTNDCKDCDFRLSLVPASQHEPGATRPVPLSRFSYPRYVGTDRGETLRPEHVDTTIYAWGPSQPIGSIPQVPYTYSYIDGSYGIMNEHQVAMGESTCSGRLVAKPVTQGGNALFDVAELGRVALERTKTAREAIKLMGSLAEQYGYYGAEWEGDYAYAEAGEALTVTDPNEAWVFHILPDDTGRSAVWVAQRVPDDHIAVVANQFTIGTIDLNDTEYYMGSSNIYDVALRNGFWDGKSEFHFGNVYSCQILYEIYCSRRMWRVYDVFASSLHLSPNATVAQLPFSVKPDRPIAIRDVMNMQRDHYEGTSYDMTKGLAAGPYGNPNRYDRGSVEGISMGILMQGTFERAISLFRTSYSFVSQSRASVPSPIGGVLWFGFSSPHATCYVPLYPSGTSLPDAYRIGSLYQYQHDSAWWTVTLVSNWAERMYKYIIQDVQAAQSHAELSQIKQQLEVEQHARTLLGNGDVDGVKALLTSYHTQNAQNVHKTWTSLFELLVTKYHDGYRLDDFHASTIDPTAVFYPIPWLKAVGFFPYGIDWNHTTYQYTSFPHDVRVQEPVTRSDAPAIIPGSHRGDTVPLPPVIIPDPNKYNQPSDEDHPIPQRSESQPVSSYTRHINDSGPGRPIPIVSNDTSANAPTSGPATVPPNPSNYPYPNYPLPVPPPEIQAQSQSQSPAVTNTLIAMPSPPVTRSLWAFDVMLMACSCLICMILGIYMGRKWERRHYIEIAEMTETHTGWNH